MSEAPVKLDRFGRDESGLTIKERLFVQEFVVDWDAKNAAIRAGYSPASAHSTGHDLKHKPKIVDALTKHLAERAERTGVNAAWVLARLVAVEADAAKAEKEGKAGNAPRLHRLKALELIGKHVDVNAFRTQLGFGPTGGGERLWDLSKLDDEELDTFERLLSKISLSGGAPSGAATEDAPEGPREALDVERRDPG